MNSVHANIISEARILLSDILSSSTDSIEKELLRTGRRMIGAYVGRLFLQNILASICFLDAITDGEKLQKINAKLIQLETAELVNTSLDYNKAVCASNFQKEVYEKVRSYTQTAQKIKNVIGFGSFLFSLGHIGTFVGGQFSKSQTPNLELATAFAISCGLSIAIPATVYGFCHWLIEGTKLDCAKQALAKDILNELSA